MSRGAGWYLVPNNHETTNPWRATSHKDKGLNPQLTSAVGVRNQSHTQAKQQASYKRSQHPSGWSFGLTAGLQGITLHYITFRNVHSRGCENLKRGTIKLQSSIFQASQLLRHIYANDSRWMTFQEFNLLFNFLLITAVGAYCVTASDFRSICVLALCVRIINISCSLVTRDIRNNTQFPLRLFVDEHPWAYECLIVISALICGTPVLTFLKSMKHVTHY